MTGSQAVLAGSAISVNAPAGGVDVSWWIWPLLLFVITFIVGIISVLAGIGGGVIFVPLVGSFFPFHLDFVRGAGLFVALSCALSAGPGLLKANLANLRLILPVALVASSFSIAGALIGLALSTSTIQIALGIIIISISFLFIFSRNGEMSGAFSPCRISRLLDIRGEYYEPGCQKTVRWTVWRMPQGLLLFALIGIVAGMFGLGAGWANVPVLNMLLGVPLRVAVGSSVVLLSITDTSAAWIYLNHGAVLPIIAVPSMIGIMLGSRVGARLLCVVRPGTIRIMVIAVLMLAGIRSMLKGLGIWG